MLETNKHLDDSKCKASIAEGCHQLHADVRNIKHVKKGVSKSMKYSNKTFAHTASDSFQLSIF